jgi:hypothetical protein
MSVLAAALDKDANPVPVVSSGSFICETWIGTSMDSFSVGGGELTGADWSFSQGYVGYNLTGTFMPGETLSLSIAGTMGEMGYQMQHKGNDLFMHIKCYDSSGKELEDLTKVIQIDDSASGTLSDSVSLAIPDNAEEVELYGSFTCSWRTPYSAASELVAVKVILESKPEPEPIPPTAEPSSDETPEGTQEPQATPDYIDGIPSGNYSKPGSAEILNNIEFWKKWEENAKKWTPEEIEEAIKEPSIVKFGGLSGETWVLRAWDEDIDQAIFADYDTPLYHGDLIVTRTRSGAILSWSDMSTFVVSENSCVVLDIKHEKESKFALVAGNVWVNLKKMIHGGSMEVEMGQAVAGIKGTTFICEEIDGVSIVKVFKGTVEVTAKATGKSVMVNSGEKLSTDSTSKGTLTMFDMEAELAGWEPYVQQVTAEAMEEVDRKSGGFPVVIVVVLVILVVAGVMVVVFIATRNKRKTTGTPTYAAPIQGYRQQGSKFCPNCGNPQGENGKFCGKCGQRLL